MKCPTCGNEVTQGEVFCGQCGTPRMAVPPGYPGTNTPSPRTGLLSAGTYSAQTEYAPPGTFRPAQTPSPHMPSGTLPPPNSTPLAPINPYQQTGFYHNATEAMPPVQHAPSGLLPGYSQQFPGTVDPARGQFTPHAAPATYPFQTGNYADPPTQQPFSTGQSYHYGSQSQFPSPPRKQGNQIVLIVCIVLVIVLLGVVSITTVALLNRPDPNKIATQPTAAPTIAPTMAPTATPTATPVPTPSPSPVVTPAPDAGFAWCGTNCNQYGFTTEFPADWQGAPATNSPGVQFANSTMPNVYVSFKTPGPTGDTSANVLMNDVQSTFGTQPGYAAPTIPPAANATIGGAPWYAIATNYNDAQNQPIHVEVYATVYQGKAYIIELQAPASNGQFDSVKQQFFVNMLVKFQFLPTAQ